MILSKNIMENQTFKYFIKFGILKQECNNCCFPCNFFINYYLNTALLIIILFMYLFKLIISINTFNKLLWLQ